MSSCHGRRDQSSQCCSAASSAETSPSTLFTAFGQKKRRYHVRTPRWDGAGDGNRTHVASLEGWSSTIELHPQVATAAPALPICLPSTHSSATHRTG